MKIFFSVFFLAISVCLPIKSFAAIIVNEVLASNDTVVSDIDFNEYSDWIELHNNSIHPVLLDGYYLSDDEAEPTKWAIPAGTQIDSNGYLVIWADDQDTGLHTNFKVSARGEFIGLYDNKGELVHGLDLPQQRTDVSFGVLTNINREITGEVYFATPTPGAQNAGKSYTAFLQPVDFSELSGIYSSSFALNLSSIDGADIYYTLDGTHPNRSSSLYQQPLIIDENVVVRARAMTDGENHYPSEIEAHSYLMHATHSLPVVSIAGESELDIEQLGRDYVKVKVTYHDKKQQRQFSQFADIKLSGSSSAGYGSSQRSVKVKASYEEKSFNYPLYPNKSLDQHSAFRLRNAGQDKFFAFLSDGLASRIISTNHVIKDIPFEGYQPTVVYIEGEYYGIMNMREDDDQYYVEDNHDVDRDDVEKEIEDHITAQMNQSDYDVSTTQGLMNVEQFYNIDQHMNTMIVGTFLDDGDFYGLNVPIWRDSSDDQAKWQFFNHDRDQSFSSSRYEEKAVADDTSVFYFLFEDTDSQYTHAMSRLINRTDYKELFLQRYMAFINLVFNASRTTRILEDIQSELQPEIERHAVKWAAAHTGYGDPSLVDEASWLTNVGIIKSFLEQRSISVKNHIKSTFGLETIELTKSVNDYEQGHIYIGNVKMPNTESVGDYILGFPIELRAEAKAGYVFSHWEGASDLTRSSIKLTLNQDASIKAVFVIDPALDIDVVFNEIQPKNGGEIVDEFGEAADWIELKNLRNTAVDLSGYYLSDDSDDLTKFQVADTAPLLTTVPAKGLLLLWADKDTDEGENHVNFKLSSSGESLYLTAPNGQSILASITFEALERGQTHARESEGGYEACDLPTPGLENVCVLEPEPVSDFTVALADANASIAENNYYTADAPSLSGRSTGELTYTLEGADQSLFSVTSQGIVRLNIYPDFEAPQDANLDNVYHYTLVVTDASGYSAKATGQVSITDVVSLWNWSWSWWSWWR